jgi:hypothetical protein
MGTDGMEPFSHADHRPEPKSRPKQPPWRDRNSPATRLLRFLYTSNPFYILSADLVFIGLKTLHAADDRVSAVWALAASLAAYTLLLALTACALIRFGGLWEDLRSLLVLIVVMFLAIAISLDDLMARDTVNGSIAYVCGYLFVIVVTECVLLATRLRLPCPYRIPYYVILGLIFLYPILISPLMGDPDSMALQWSLFGFSPLAGFAITLLIPAARLGPTYLSRLGNPWRWPFYPWTVFVVLIAGLCARSYSLCVSFHYVGGSRTIFGLYFLIPIGIATSLVWLELAIQSGRRLLMLGAASTPLCLACLLPLIRRDDEVYRHFSEQFAQALGATPCYVSLMAAIAFLAYAVKRRVPGAWELLTLGLLALAFIGPNTFAIDELTQVQPLTMTAAGLVLWVRAMSVRDGVRAAVASCFLIMGMTCFLGSGTPVAQSPWIALHLALLALLCVGAMFDDRAGRISRRMGAFALALVALLSILRVPHAEPVLRSDLAAAHILCLALVSCLYGRMLRDRAYVRSGAVIIAVWLVYFGVDTYRRARTVIPGVDQIALGLVSFVIAMSISLRKLGRSQMGIVTDRVNTGKDPDFADASPFNGESTSSPI